MKHTHQTTWLRCRYGYSSATPCFWQVFAVTTFISLGLASECFAFTIGPTALTFNAVQGTTNPPNQTLAVDRNRSRQVTLTGSDNASWLTVSPATTSMTSTAQLTVAIDIGELAVGTYNATITIKVGTKATKTVPVTLIVSPSSQPPPSAATATLAWNPVTDPTLDGYKIYVGTASGLYTRTITVGNLISYTVDSLTTRTTYYFSVTAYNSAGESSPSNEVSKSIY
jgi:hypothetical protein